MRPMSDLEEEPRVKSESVAMENDDVSQNFQVRPLPAAFGAEVVGIDLGCPLSALDFARVHQAHLDHHLLVFRNQHITPAQQVAFSQRFGALQVHVLPQFRLPEYPEVLIVSNILQDDKPIGLGDAGVYWHSDMSYKERPALGTMLYAKELPSEGGDTLFANMHAVLAALPESLAERLEGRYAEHSYVHKHVELRKLGAWRPKLTEQQLRDVKPVSHPMVRTHPESGRQALYVSEHFTTRVIGMPEDESQALLRDLFAISIRDEHVYRHVWSDHDLVFWDNRSLMHRAGGTPDNLRRLMYRTTIEGDVPR